MITNLRILAKKSLLIIFSVFALGLNNIYAQNVLDDQPADMVLGDVDGLFSETIRIISRSGRIFILSNSNQLLNKGDFITILLKESGPVARAVVAKTHEESVGIKILKVYSLRRWGLMGKGLDVQIKKGDDSNLFAVKKKKSETDTPATKIEGEEDLFNDKALLDENLGNFYQDNRLIKPDNIVSAGWNRYEFANDLTGDREAHNQWNFTWAYQFSDNYWFEGLYGRVQVDGLPAAGAQTIINNFTARVKYTFKAPLYSFVMPYVGFQTYSVSSPQAGVQENESDAAKLRAQQEVDLINKLQVSQLVFGATLLRRLVPGWFLKLDVGNDILSVGFAIEF